MTDEIFIPISEICSSIPDDQILVALFESADPQWTEYLRDHLPVGQSLPERIREITTSSLDVESDDIEMVAAEPNGPQWLGNILNGCFGEEAFDEFREIVTSRIANTVEEASKVALIFVSVFIKHDGYNEADVLISDAHLEANKTRARAEEGAQKVMDMAFQTEAEGQKNS